MLDWLKYLLTVLMGLTLVVVTSPCLCRTASAHEGSEALVPSQSEPAPHTCGCATSAPVSDEPNDEPDCCDECHTVSSSTDPDPAPTLAALGSSQQDDRLGDLPDLSPRLQAVFLAWFADFVGAAAAIDADGDHSHDHSSPPCSDSHRYLALNVLRL